MVTDSTAARAGLLSISASPPSNFGSTIVNPGDQVTATVTVNVGQKPFLIDQVPTSGFVAIDYSIIRTVEQFSVLSETGGPPVGAGDLISQTPVHSLVPPDLLDFEFFDAAPFVTQPFTFVETFEVTPQIGGGPFAIYSFGVTELFLNDQGGIIGFGFDGFPITYELPSAIPEPGTLLLSTVALSVAGARWFAKRLRSRIRHDAEQFVAAGMRTACHNLLLGAFEGRVAGTDG